jgi:hypothetical protein
MQKTDRHPAQKITPSLRGFSDDSAFVRRQNRLGKKEGIKIA